MNDLSFSRSDDPERDKQIVDLVIGGKRVDDVAQMMVCTVADVNLCLDRAAAAYLTAQSRVRSIFVVRHGFGTSGCAFSGGQG
jgi:hypothetical protein